MIVPLNNNLIINMIVSLKTLLFLFTIHFNNGISLVSSTTALYHTSVSSSISSRDLSNLQYSVSLVGSWVHLSTNTRPFNVIGTSS